jgi:hypothetical protein
MGFGVVVCLQIVQMIIMLRMIGLNKVNIYYKHYYQNIRYSKYYGILSFYLYFDCASKNFNLIQVFFGSGTRIFGGSQTKGLSAEIWTK